MSNYKNEPLLGNYNNITLTEIFERMAQGLTTNRDEILIRHLFAACIPQLGKNDNVMSFLRETWAQNIRRELHAGVEKASAEQLFKTEMAAAVDAMGVNISTLTDLDAAPF